MSRSVSILLIARDRFSLTEECLDNLLRRTSAPEQIVCVAAGVPQSVFHYLQAVSRKHGVQLIRRESPMSSNAARRLGLESIEESKWTVVLENDVLVEPGWLDALLTRAELEQADVVVPVVNRVLPERVHLPSNASSAPTGREGSEIPAVLCADPAWATCLLARGPAERIASYFDPSAGAIVAHWDLWLELRQAAAKVVLEPRAVVASCRRAPLRAWDEAFFAGQWSDSVLQTSIEYFCDKWQLNPADETFQALLQQSRAVRDSLLGHYRLSRYVGQRAAAWWHYVAAPLHRLVGPAEAESVVVAPQILTTLPQLANSSTAGTYSR